MFWIKKHNLAKNGPGKFRHLSTPQWKTLSRVQQSGALGWFFHEKLGKKHQNNECKLQMGVNENLQFQ